MAAALNLSSPLGGGGPAKPVEGYYPIVNGTPLRQSLRDCHLPLQGRIMKHKESRI
jgi:hypothetical protein